MVDALNASTGDLIATDHETSVGHTMDFEIAKRFVTIGGLELLQWRRNAAKGVQGDTEHCAQVELRQQIVPPLWIVVTNTRVERKTLRTRVLCVSTSLICETYSVICGLLAGSR